MKLIEAIAAITVFALTTIVSLPLLWHAAKDHRVAAERISRVAIARERIAAFELACKKNEIPPAPDDCAIKTCIDGHGTTVAIMAFDISGKRLEVFSEVRHEDDHP